MVEILFNVARRKKKVIAAILAAAAFLLYVVASYKFAVEIIRNGNRTWADLKYPLSDFNFYKLKGKLEMILDLPTCKIPVDVEDALVANSKSAVSSDRDSCQRNLRLTFLENGNILKLNPVYKDASCCYTGIHRVPGRDNETVLAHDCLEIPATKDGTIIEHEDAILVNCKYGRREYTDYHAIITSTTNEKSSNAQIPNILIIGLDSVSRFHFEQLMPKTRKVLKDLGSIEMQGYAKVGLNTFPNAIAFLTGYSEDEASELCYKRYEPIDECPFIWKNLTQEISTAFIEDAPGLATFNYYKYGFSHPPAKHYLRPLMQRAAEDHKYTFPCVGSRTTESFVLDHIKQLVSLKSPLFLFTWLTSLAHEGLENLPNADRLFSKYFQDLNSTLHNTILVFMSDHGLRYGDSRRTFNGWFNAKLPFFTITIPEKLRQILGEQKIRQLQQNSRKLTTPFDFYHTLNDLMITFNLKPKTNDSKNGFYKNSKFYPRTFGQSLFTPISENRTCPEAGIPKQFCPCATFESMNLSDPLLHRGARDAITTINGWLPDKCKPLRVNQITAGAKLNDKEYIVGFKTSPGGFHFEAVARFNPEANDSNFESGPHLALAQQVNGTQKETITRLNSVNFDETTCTDDWFLELYCYCDFFKKIVGIFGRW